MDKYDVVIVGSGIGGLKRGMILLNQQMLLLGTLTIYIKDLIKTFILSWLHTMLVQLLLQRLFKKVQEGLHLFLIRTCHFQLKPETIFQNF